MVDAGVVFAPSSAMREHKVFVFLAWDARIAGTSLANYYILRLMNEDCYYAPQKDDERSSVN